jgi:hypothetical protein
MQPAPESQPLQRESKEHVRMSRGRIQIRPLGGGPGCLLMVLFSILASVLLTVAVNLLLR